MKYLHLFDNQEDYENKKNELILPSASLIEDIKEVKYDRVHDYVEIAGIKWATMNVGANSITDYGLYFQWGDTKGYTASQVGTGEDKKKFADDDSDYKWYDTKTSAFTKYNSTGETLALDDDAVHAAWGGSWRMPTTGDIITIYSAITASTVTTAWTSDYQNSKVSGMVFTDNVSNATLFFPACGHAYDGSVNYAGVGCYYWMNSLSTDYNSTASAFLFARDGFLPGYVFRRLGYTVRGVWDDNLTNQT